MRMAVAMAANGGVKVMMGGREVVGGVMGRCTIGSRTSTTRRGCKV